MGGLKQDNTEDPLSGLNLKYKDKNRVDLNGN
jgi:hypothetical protein